MHFVRWRSLALVTLVCLAAASFLVASDEPTLTKDEIKHFLLTAKVVKSREIGRGVTSPLRLTLTDGKLIHDAVFQVVDEHKPIMQLASGRRELNFVDSYRYDIAAYELAELLGLDNMMPVTVERKWQGKTGALSWWINWKWDEEMRLKEKLQPPDPDAWNKQMYKMWVFAQLLYDTDRNLGNALITEDWKLWMIDFTRAFRLNHNLENSKNLVRCDRQLLEKLKQLDPTIVEQKTKGHLTKGEVEALMARHDKIVAHFQELIAQKGEREVLY